VYHDGVQCTAISTIGGSTSEGKDGWLRGSVSNRSSAECKKLRILRKFPEFQVAAR
jgi:hypothetical protein